jgi:hypothetical protein
MRSSCMAPRASISHTRSAMSACRNSTRSAEQRWPAELKAEATTSRTTCSGSAVESTIMAFCPPVSAISGTMGPRFAASVLVDLARHLGRAGEGDAGARAVGDQQRADPAPVARQERQRVGGDAGLCSQRTASGGDQRRLLGRLGDHAVAGGERRRDLAEEDRQREVPRADADEGATSAQRQAVALAGRAGQQDCPRANCSRACAA